MIFVGKITFKRSRTPRTFEPLGIIFQEYFERDVLVPKPRQLRYQVLRVAVVSCRVGVDRKGR